MGYACIEKAWPSDPKRWAPKVNKKKKNKLPLTVRPNGITSGMARVRLADLKGPKWTSSGQNGPFWSILVLRMPKSSSEQGHFDQNGRLDHFGPVHFPTVQRPFPITDRAKWVFTSILRFAADTDTEKLMWNKLCFANADAAVLCSLDRAAQQRKWFQTWFISALFLHSMHKAKSWRRHSLIVVEIP